MNIIDLPASASPESLSICTTMFFHIRSDRHSLRLVFSLPQSSYLRVRVIPLVPQDDSMEDKHRKLLPGPGLNMPVYAAFATHRETEDEPLSTVNMKPGGNTSPTLHSRVFYGGIEIPLKVCLSLLN